MMNLTDKEKEEYQGYIDAMKDELARMVGVVENHEYNLQNEDWEDEEQFQDFLNFIYGTDV